MGRTKYGSGDGQRQDGRRFPCRVAWSRVAPGHAAPILLGCEPNLEPYVVEISGVDPEDAFRRLASHPYCAFLDSARQTPQLGRYSFIAAEPFAIICEQNGDRGLGRLQRLLASFSAPCVDGLPPFQGGAVGLFSYELSKSFERLPTSCYDEFSIPAVAVGLYDVVVAFDHEEERSWVISQGFPETESSPRRNRARLRAESCLRWLETPDQNLSVVEDEVALPTPAAPTFPTDTPDVFSNFEPESYLRAIQDAIDYIGAGDVFQVNLSQRLICRAKSSAAALYTQMRKLNAAPFAAFFDLGNAQIVSASPERFLSVRDRHIEARPIKGTRQRMTRPEADLFSGAELLGSSKDLAENVMIVDLMRNDLSRVCEDDSIQVTQLCGLETFEFVQHLVSVVRGSLRDDVTALDVLRSTFPGGSITGAPKVRAMEIISELEPTARNAYCGSLGYIGFDGDMDLNILIRTVTVNRGWWQFPVGGGIVGQSDPEQEYLETLVKAEGMLRAINACPQTALAEPGE